MRRRRGNCCPKEIVHPVKQNVVNCCTEETVNHIHPSHTTVVNHHLIKNNHIFPHSTSVQNQVNSVDVYGGSFNTPPNQVGGAMQGPGSGMGMNNQVAGSMQGHGSNMGMNHQVGGTMHQKPCHPHGMGPGMVGGMSNCKKSNKWC